MDDGGAVNNGAVNNAAGVMAAGVMADLRAQGLHVTPDGRVLPDVAARVIGVSEGTLRNWRNAEAGPDYFKAGRIWYRLDDLLAWIESRRAIGSTESHALSSNVTECHAKSFCDIDAAGLIFDHGNHDDR